MKNICFFASFLANTKKKRRQAARAAGAEGFPAGRRAAQAANLPTEREEARGRETAPAALPRDNQLLPLSRAKRERRSRVGFGAREGKEIDA